MLLSEIALAVNFFWVWLLSLMLQNKACKLNLRIVQSQVFHWISIFEGMEGGETSLSLDINI